MTQTPIHPGEHLKEEMSELGMSAADLAKGKLSPGLPHFGLALPSALSGLRRRYSASARALCKLILSALSTNRSNSALSLLVIVP